jgi:hypothetical protein
MSTPIRATLWIYVVGTTPSPSRSPPSVPLVNAGAAATDSLSSDRPLSRNEGASTADAAKASIALASCGSPQAALRQGSQGACAQAEGYRSHWQRRKLLPPTERRAHDTPLLAADT